jgi:outer membrane protein
MSRIAAVISVSLVLLGICPGFAAQSAQKVPQAITLGLGEAVRMALSRSSDILIANAQAAQAAETVREMHSLNRPQAVVGSGLAYNNGFPLSIEGSAPSLVQIGVTQSIFSKKNKNLILESEQSSLAGRIGADSARNQVAARVALIYNELFRARQANVFWTERLASLDKEREIIAPQVEAGRLRPLDLTLSRSALSGARQELLSSQERIRLAEVELRQLTGVPAGSAIAVTEPDLNDPSLDAPAEEIFRRAAEIHPEIREADATLQARKLHIESVRGEKYPQLLVVSQYAVFSKANNYQDYFKTFVRNNFLAGLSVQFPIFTGSRTEAQISRSVQEAETARLQLERLKDNLRLNIERTCSGLRIARSAVEVAHDAAAAAGESLEIEESLLEAGRIGFREIQAARSQLAEKRIGELDAAKALFDRKVELLRLTGVSAQTLAK